jgi:hypothetical protein
MRKSIKAIVVVFVIRADLYSQSALSNNQVEKVEIELGRRLFMMQTFLSTVQCPVQHVMNKDAPLAMATVSILEHWMTQGNEMFQA